MSSLHKVWTAKDIEFIFGISQATLRSIQRAKFQDSIGFIPDFKATSLYEENRYSYRNLIQLSIWLEMKKLGLPRQLLKTVSRMISDDSVHTDTEIIFGTDTVKVRIDLNKIREDLKLKIT